MHFPSILYLIDEQRRLGARVTVVPPTTGFPSTRERLIEAIDEQTAIVNLSHVLFKSAYIHDVAAIAEKARRVEAITVIDGYQAVGTIPVDVRALGIDVYIGGCLKWLCGGPGNAFIWVDPDLRRRLRPKLTGWMAHQRPFAFEPELVRRDDAWRLLHGTPNISGLVRGPARPGDHQRDRHRGDPCQVANDRQRGSSNWPIKPATAARLRATRRGEPEPSRSMSTMVTRSPSASSRATSSATTARARASGSRRTSIIETTSSTRPSRRSAKSAPPARGGRSRRNTRPLRDKKPVGAEYSESICQPGCAASRRSWPCLQLVSA